MVDAPSKSEPERFSPRSFLRARRPERFSDSVASERPILDRTTLEYHLDTLTNRNQEALFEEFARQLAQHEVCPNLQPHTGPTGGGDSKVDSETYPVAKAISDGWFVGTDGAAGSERWAFAISAQKQWAPKLRADIASLVGTGRGYVKSFFISSRFIKDKQRAAEEDALGRQYGLDVRILDRNWILDRVFAGKHEQLAITTLNISVPYLSEVRKGPLDTQRERDLEDTENRIKATLADTPSLSLVNACLEAALLSRNLERPRTETDGRFVRAQRLATDHGTRHQQVLAFYEHAWTLFWWHEDFAGFERLYRDVEGLTVGTDNIADAELLSNLWTLLYSSVAHGHLTAAAANRDGRTGQLQQTLKALASHEDRPSVALQARSMLALMALEQSVGRNPDKAFRELNSIVAEAHGLIGFPLASLSELITALSDFFVGNAAFEKLFLHLVDVTAKRQGEVAGAKMLLKLGAEQLDAQHPYDAIRTLGRALSRLYKHESRRAMVRALRLCAGAYERAGLLWAARGSLLHAASIAGNEWWADSAVTLAQHQCYNRLKWVELQLGRVPQTLAWHQADLANRSALEHEGYSPERLSNGERDFDAIFAILLLRSDIWQLKQLERLPDALHRLDLHMAGAAVVFALGHTDEKGTGSTLNEAEQTDMLRQLASQPAGNELPPGPLLMSEQTLTFRSVVLGCTIELTTANQSPLIELSESILAAIESFLATSILEGVFPRIGLLRLRVKHSDFGTFPFTFEWTELEGLPVADIRCPSFATVGLNGDQQQSLKSSIADLVTEILARVFWIDGEDTVKQLIHDELALVRAVDFTGSFGVVANALGPSPPVTVKAWSSDTHTHFELRRSVEWDAAARAAARETAPPRIRPSHLETVSGPVPDELLDVSQVRHSELSFESLIREGLWNRAKWRAIGWAVIEGLPPWMVFGFENGKAAAEILTHLVQEIGRDDPENRLRITIITGISKRHPQHYRVVIGSNVSPDDVTKFGAVIFRVHTMTPDSSTNLNMFLTAYRAAEAFLFGIGVVDPRSPQVPKPMQHGYVLKKALQVREAWSIGLNDMDGPGVMPDDDVFIPPGHYDDAPVLELLRWKREHSRRDEPPSPRANKTRRTRNGQAKVSRRKNRQQRRRK